jgi:hypothetical protein
MSSEELIRRLYAAFDPFKPSGDRAYVDLQTVRGDGNILEELGTDVLVI